MNHTSRLQTGQQLLTADFFTEDHRFSATVATGKRSLADVLNDQLTNYLDVSEVYVSRINAPGEILGTCEIASLAKENIDFVILNTESNQLTQARKYQTGSLPKSSQRVFLSIGSFELVGELEHSGKLDLKAILASGTTKFMPIRRGQVVDANRPDVSFAAPVILVNKTSIDFLSVPRKIKPYDDIAYGSSSNSSVDNRMPIAELA